MKKKINRKHKIINHISRHWLFFAYISIFLLSLVMEFSMNQSSAEDLMTKIFQPAQSQNAIINLWNSANAVGNEVFREGVGIQDNFGMGCFVNWQVISSSSLSSQKSDLWSSLSDREFCEQILWWDMNVPVTTKQAPLIVRITKFLLRITMVLSVTMVIYNGVMYIIEASKWWDVKDATKNLWYVALWILLALMSLW